MDMGTRAFILELKIKPCIEDSTAGTKEEIVTLTLWSIAAIFALDCFCLDLMGERNILVMCLTHCHFVICLASFLLLPQTKEKKMT